MARVLNRSWYKASINSLLRPHLQTCRPRLRPAHLLHRPGQLRRRGLVLPHRPHRARHVRLDLQDLNQPLFRHFICRNHLEPDVVLLHIHGLYYHHHFDAYGARLVLV